MSAFLTERRSTAGRRRAPSAPVAAEPGPAARLQPAALTAPTVIDRLLDTRLIAKALTIRRTEERLLALFAEGRLTGTVHTCIGQEWVGVAVAEHLRPGDFVFSNHRCHGHYLAWTDDVDGLVAELMGRATGVCGGRGGSQHLCRGGFFSNGIQGGIVPVAAGLAMAHRLAGSEHLAVVFIGDGTLGEGVVYETLNIAAGWSLPLLIVLEDNGIAQSTAQHETMSGTIVNRMRAFGIEVRSASTDDPVDLLAEAGDAVHDVRLMQAPLVLHVRTQRLRAHSKGDDTRDPALIDALAQRDTLNQIIATGSPPIHDLIQAIDRRLDAAVARAAAAPATLTPVDIINTQSLSQKPCGTGVSPVGSQGLGISSQDAPSTSLRWKPATGQSGRIVELIRSALGDAMADDNRIILLGEDLRDPYGGAFKVTAGLSSRFDHRVRNAPISEAAIVGIGNGLALAGYRPVVEIMFGDFVLLAADQIVNHAAKFAGMYNDQVAVPILIRTPMGGYRGYGPTHSQSLEKHLLGVPGLRVVAPHGRCDIRTLYGRLLAENDQPTLVIENKLLYGQMLSFEPAAGWRLETTGGPLPTSRLACSDTPQLTLVAYGGMSRLAEETAHHLLQEEDIACDVLLPTQIYPLDVRPIAESVRRTGRVLMMEEGQGFAGFGSEVIARLAASSDITRLRAERVHALACPIPAARTAEQQVLPDLARVVSAARDLILGTLVAPASRW